MKVELLFFSHFNNFSSRSWRLVPNGFLRERLIFHSMRVFQHPAKEAKEYKDVSPRASMFPRSGRMMTGRRETLHTGFTFAMKAKKAAGV
jgi:hypothetical protein